MRLKIRCDGESEKFCNIFWALNKALLHLLHTLHMRTRWKHIVRRGEVSQFFIIWLFFEENSLLDLWKT